MKKAQITLFMIIGIVLLFLFSIMFFSQGSSSKIIPGKNSPDTEINYFIDSCLEKVTFEGLDTIGKKGGYFDVPNIISFENTSYWCYAGNNIQPSIEQITSRIEQYATENIDGCLDFQTFESRGYNFTKKTLPSITVILSRGKISAKMNFLFEMRKANTLVLLKSSSFEAKSSFFERFSAGKDIVNRYVLNKNISDESIPSGLSNNIIVSREIKNQKDLLIKITDNSERKANVLSFGCKFE